VLLQRDEVAGRKLDDAARRQDRLGDERREAARALAVDEVEPVVQLVLPVDGAVSVGEPS